MPLQPTEWCYTLSEIYFSVLRKGEQVPAEENARALFAGILVTVVTTAISILYTTDIKKFSSTQLLLFVGLLGAGAVSLTEIVLRTLGIRKMTRDTTYLMVTDEIQAFFKAQRTPEKSPPSIPQEPSAPA